MNSSSVDCGSQNEHRNDPWRLLVWVQQVFAAFLNVSMKCVVEGRFRSIRDSKWDLQVRSMGFWEWERKVSFIVVKIWDFKVKSSITVLWITSRCFSRNFCREG